MKGFAATGSCVDILSVIPSRSVSAPCQATSPPNLPQQLVEPDPTQVEAPDSQIMETWREGSMALLLTSQEWTHLLAGHAQAIVRAYRPQHEVYLAVLASQLT